MSGNTGGEAGILPEHPKKFSVAMVKLKSFVVNERIVENPFCSVIGKSEAWIFARSLRKSLLRYEESAELSTDHALVSGLPECGPDNDED